jgi:hypothetical protein
VDTAAIDLDSKCDAGWECERRVKRTAELKPRSLSRAMSFAFSEFALSIGELQSQIGTRVAAPFKTDPKMHHCSQQV